MHNNELWEHFDIEGFLKSVGHKNDNNAEKVYFYILKNIFQNTFQVGSYLTEAHISKTLQVSNGPVREALARLRNDGWIKTERRKGSIIIDYRDPEKFAKLHQDRRIIEIGCATDLAQSASYRQLAEIEEATENIEKAIKDQNGFLYRDADLRFHYKIVEPIVSPRLLSLWLHSILQLSYVIFPGSEAEFLKLGNDVNPDLIDASHRKVFEAIAARNETLVRTLMMKHLHCNRIPGEN